MRFLKLFFLSCIILLSCVSPKKEKASEFNAGLLKQYTNADSGIIISCFRCSCIIDFAEFYYSRHRTPVLILDTACASVSAKGIVLVHMPQKILDSIYENNYNAILFKHLHSTTDFEYKLLKTEDHESYMKITKKFFK